ncbi:MAG: hypothetical protein AB1714_08680 [Acidobacteriota bacterium]
MMNQQQQNDPVIDEIRALRHSISARFDHDPEQLVAYYIRLQDQYRDRLIDTTIESERADQSAA